jgi:hypothetical protein
VNPQLANIRYNALMGLEDVPDSQSGAVASSIMATLGDQSNRYFGDASRQNAFATQQADQYNAQTGDREQMINTQLAQQYENIAQRALENTYNEWADYFGNAKRMNAERLREERMNNYINSMFENYSLRGNGQMGFNGNGMQY